MSVGHSIPSCSLHESLQSIRGLGLIHYGDQGLLPIWKGWNRFCERFNSQGECPSSMSLLCQQGSHMTVIMRGCSRNPELNSPQSLWCKGVPDHAWLRKGCRIWGNCTNRRDLVDWQSIAGRVTRPCFAHVMSTSCSSSLVFAMGWMCCFLDHGTWLRGCHSGLSS